MAATVTTLTTSIKLFNRGPITELYVPPTSCYQTLTSGTDNGYLFAGHFMNSYFDPACYPPGTIGASGLEEGTAWDFYYYSPGICPSGWTTATAFSGEVDGFLDVVPIGTDTSAALCCPTGFQYEQFGHECFSQVALSQIITYVMPTQAGPSLNRGRAFTNEIQTTTTVSCDGIPIWWQASDVALLSAASRTAFSAGLSPTTLTSPATSSVTTHPVVSSTYLPTTSSSPISSPSNSKSQGLSTGGKIAMGLCIPLAFFAVLAGVLWYFQKRRVHLEDTHHYSRGAHHSLVTRIFLRKRRGQLEDTHNYSRVDHDNIKLFEIDSTQAYELPDRRPPVAHSHTQRGYQHYRNTLHELTA